VTIPFIGPACQYAGFHPASVETCVYYKCSASASHQFTASGCRQIGTCNFVGLRHSHSLHVSSGIVCDSGHPNIPTTISIFGVADTGSFCSGSGFSNLSNRLFIIRMVSTKLAIATFSGCVCSNIIVSICSSFVIFQPLFYAAACSGTMILSPCYFYTYK